MDLVPFIDESKLAGIVKERLNDNIVPEDVILGLLPNKFGRALLPVLSSGNIRNITAELKHRRFVVLGTRGWNEAEFTSGGVDVNGMNKRTLESLFRKGLFFCGEVVDVVGRRGGFNLAWAWASGLLAGESV